MDFVHDQLFNVRPFPILTVVDRFNRQRALLEPRLSFGGQDVVAALERAIARAGTPVSITVDHGTEFTSRALEDWAYRRGVKLHFIRPEKPTETGHIESFNGRLRDECLNVMPFETPDDAERKLDAWRIDDNGLRHHSSICNLTPNEFGRRRQENRVSVAATL